MSARDSSSPISADPVQAACARLARSRDALRERLIQPAETASPTGVGFGGVLAEVWKRRFDGLLSRLREKPALRVVSDTLAAWWQAHPWRDCVELAGLELRERVLPVVRRHARTTVVVAFVGGVLLALTRPWRWPLLNRQIAPLSSRLSRWLMNELAHLPVQSMLAALMLMASERRRETAPESEEARRPEAVGDV